MNRRVFQFALSIVGAISAISVVAVFVGVSPMDRAFDEWSGLIVPRGGSSVLRLTEGGADSHFGSHGFNGELADRLDNQNPLIFLHGDSYIEALQVSDECKPDAVMTRHFGGKAVAIGVGRSGAGLKSYIKRAACYEKAHGHPLCHVFFVASVRDDLFHDQGSEMLSRSQLLFSRFVNRFHLNALLAIYSAGRGLAKGRLRLVPWMRHESRSCNREVGEIKSATQAFASEIKESVFSPVLIVYCPNVPRLQDGEVSFSDDESAEAVVFKNIITESGIDFIDATPALAELWNQRKLFARGFSNASGPGSGHLNEVGVEAVFGYLARKVKERHGL